MAGPLTWRNVDAPDFGRSMEGVGEFSKLLTGALDRLNGGIKQFDDSKTDQVNKIFQTELLKQQDPMALKAALESGELFNRFGSNAARISGVNIAAAGARENQLLDTAQAESNLKFTGQERARTVDNWAAQDGAQGIFAAIAAAGGDQGKINSILADPANAAAIGKLRAPDIMSMSQFGTGAMRDKATLEGALLGNTRTGIGIESDRFNLDEAKRTPAIRNYVDRMMQFGTTAEAQRFAIENIPEGYRADALALYQARGLGGASNPGTPLDGVLTGPDGAPVSGGAFDVVLGNGKYGNPSKPITSMSIGEAQDFGENVLQANSRAAGVGKLPSGKVVGSSAMGAFQITRTTLDEFAPKVLGANWKSQPFSAENQDKIAEAIFNASKGGNLKARWEGLPDSRPGAYANKSWSEMRHIIAGVESKPLNWQPNAPKLAADALATQMQSNMSGNQYTEVARTFKDEWNKNETNDDVATRIAKAKGMPYKTVLRQIEQIRDEGGVNASVAGRIAERSITGQSRVSTLLNNLPFSDGNISGRVFNDKQIADDIAMFKRNGSGIAKEVIRIGAQEQALKDMPAAEANVKNAAAVYNARRIAGQNTGQAEIDYRNAVAQRDALLRAGIAEAGNRPRGADERREAANPTVPNRRPTIIPQAVARPVPRGKTPAQAERARLWQSVGMGVPLTPEEQWAAQQGNGSLLNRRR